MNVLTVKQLLKDHPDVIEIDASNNGVNEVRDLIDKVKYAPINAKYKVYIIDEVHVILHLKHSMFIENIRRTTSTYRIYSSNNRTT